MLGGAALVACLVLVVGCAPTANEPTGAAVVRNTTTADRTLRVVGGSGSADFRVGAGQTLLVDAKGLGEVRSVILLGAGREELVAQPFGPPSDPFSSGQMLLVEEGDGLGVASLEGPQSAAPAARDFSCRGAAAS